MSEKKAVRRSLAIALGMICIILVASIGLVIAHYTMALGKRDELYDDYVSSHSYTNDAYLGAIKSFDRVGRKADELMSILQLEKVVTVWAGPLERELPVNFSTNPNIGETLLSSGPPFGFYPGIAYVQVSSTSNETYVTVAYSAKNVQFDYNSQTDAGTNGTVVFPVMPTEVIHIRIAVHGTSTGATANVTITYYY
jgi:hypothetical protein